MTNKNKSNPRYSETKEPAVETKAKTAEKTATQQKEKPDYEVVTSIFARPFDIFFIINYILIFAIVLVVFVARCPKIMPATLIDYDLKDAVCPRLKSALEGSMGTALNTYKGWVDKVYNPKVSLAITCAHRMNTFVVGPLSLYMIYAFITGCEDAKNWGLVHAICMFYGMVIQDTVGWHALLERRVDVVGADASTFFLVTFGFATFFPVMVLLRLWPTYPFSLEEYKKKSKMGCCDSLLSYLTALLCWIWMLGALVFYYEFCVKNLSFASGLPSVFDRSAEIWEQTAPQREALMQQTAVYQDMAAEYTKQASAAAGNVAEQVGDGIIQFAKGIQGEDKQ